jgi:hypothetical protein
LSVIKQQFIASVGSLYNIPDPSSVSDTPSDSILVIGTPTSTDLTLGFSTSSGKQIRIYSKGNFQWGTGAMPKNLSELLELQKLNPGFMTEQTAFVGSSQISKESFLPAISSNDYDLIDRNLAVAARIYAGNDTFIGATDSTSKDDSDTVDGFAGNDVFYGNGSGKYDDIFYGGDGVDTSVLRGKSTNYTITQSSDIWNSYTKKSELKGFYVKDKTGLDGQQALSSVERLKFSDKSIALDLDQNAGVTAKILGAVFSKSSVANKEYVGIGLDLLDKGMNFDTLAGLALNAAKATTNDQIVTTLWTNVVGSAPSVGDKAPFIKMLVDGMTPGALAHMAADTPLNTSNINLVGLAQTGIEYTPVV